jgi:hypothetical protein
MFCKPAIGAAVFAVIASALSSGVASANTATPTVTAVFRNQGPMTGGTKVFVAGTGFTSDATVAFGAVAATKVVFESSNLVIATSPAEPVGTVDIIVTTPAGSSTATPEDAFTFTDNTPVVKQVFPHKGNVAGGTLVLVKGQHFTQGATVDFGTVAATKVVFESKQILLARSPAETAGTVDVTVTTAAGQSATTAEDAFTFVLPSGSGSPSQPVVARLFPKQGPVSGGTTVYILGRGFITGSTVMFGTTPASTVLVRSHHIIVATSPVEPAGSVDVTVTTTLGTSPITDHDVFNFN